MTPTEQDKELREKQMTNMTDNTQSGSEAERKSTIEYLENQLRHWSIVLKGAGSYPYEDYIPANIEQIIKELTARKAKALEQL